MDKINITELCQAAGVNRTTFYRYYELPRDILLEMQSELENNVRLLSAYLAGGTYFLARQWIMEDIPISPKEAANIVLNILERISHPN